MTEREQYAILDDIRGLPLGTSYREMVKYTIISVVGVLVVSAIALFSITYR